MSARLSRWRPRRLWIVTAQLALIVAVALAALATNSGRASASFLDDVEALAASTEDALESGDLSDEERQALSDLIAELVDTLESDPASLGDLDSEQLAGITALLAMLQEQFDDAGEQGLSEAVGTLATKSAGAASTTGGTMVTMASSGPPAAVKAALAEFHETKDACRQDFSEALAAFRAGKPYASEAAKDNAEALKDEAEAAKDECIAAAETAKDQVEEATAATVESGGPPVAVKAALAEFHETKSACQQAFLEALAAFRAGKPYESGAAKEAAKAQKDAAGAAKGECIAAAATAKDAAKDQAAAEALEDPEDEGPQD